VADYGFRVPQSGDYRIILNSDAPEFGGHDRIDDNIVYRTFCKEGDSNHYLNIYITNRTALVLKRME
jgi:1,4-alpha-glucan branching enzyme